LDGLCKDDYVYRDLRKQRRDRLYSNCAPYNAIELQYTKGAVLMTANALVQTLIDSAVKERAAAVLGELGITVSDAVRILLTRTANEGALPFALVRNATEHDVWFRTKVQQALDDPRPAIPHEQVEAHFAKRRAAALRKGER
jgi:DNA-damage-inducible protein J